MKKNVLFFRRLKVSYADRTLSVIVSFVNFSFNDNSP